MAAPTAAKSGAEMYKPPAADETVRPSALSAARGYGKALVDHSFALKGPLTVEVFRDNEIGRRFYERYGFVPVSEEPHTPSGQVVCTMAMPPGVETSAPYPPD